jgi:hypothetical protein
MSRPFTFLDLGQHYKDRLSSNANPLSGKFVQLRHSDLGEFIIFAPLDLCPYHAQIVNLFSQLQTPQWAFELNLRKDDGQLYEEKAEIIGGGYFEILEERKRINLSGQSLAYGDYEPYGLPENLGAVPCYQGYKVFC